MNPPPALVAAFVARLDRVLEHLSAELRPGDVLVYRAPHWNNPPAELAPPIPADKLLTAERGRMPVPLTVAEALATVDAARDALAAMFAAELGNAAAALLPAEYQAGALEDPAVLAAWPVRAPGFPDRARDLVLATLRAELAERVARVDLAERAARDVVDAGPVREDLAALRAELATAMSRAQLFRAPVSPAGPVEALSHLLERVPNLPGEDAAVLGTLPAVASWARGAPLTDEAGRYLGTFPSAGLNALYRHLWARSPLFAAVEAGRLVRELTAAGDPGPAYMAAIRDALGSYARSVEDPDALAAAALEDTPTARRRLLAFTSDLLDAARRVAALFAVDPVDEDAARETAETSHGPSRVRAPALRWDVAFAAELDRLGGARADTVRKNAAARWAAVYGPQVPIPDTPRPAPGSLWGLWAADVDGPPLWLRVLARELWVSEWKPALERERIRPAVTARIGRGIVALHSPATLERTTAEGVELVTVAGDLAGRVELDALTRSLFARGAGSVVPADEARRAATELVRARATTAAVFAFLHAIRTVTALARRGDDGLRETWESWNAWVDEVAACYEVKPTPDLRRLLCNVAWFGNAVQVPLFDGRTQRGLWNLTAPDPFKRGRPDPTAAREVAFSYAPIFDPKWAARENAADRNRGVRLMAIPDRLPVGVSNPAIRGSLYLFTLDVLAEVTMAPDPDRGVRLDARRPDLARGVALADENAEHQLRAMLNDTPTQGPLLELVSGNRYRLAGEDARTLSAPRFQRGSR